MFCSTETANISIDGNAEKIIIADVAEFIFLQSESPLKVG